MVVERDLKRITYDKKETEEVFSRKCRLLEEENSILRLKFSEASHTIDKSSVSDEANSNLRNLENKYQEIKE